MGILFLFIIWPFQKKMMMIHVEEEIHAQK